MSIQWRHGGGTKYPDTDDNDVINVSSTEYADAQDDDQWTNITNNMGMQIRTIIIQNNTEYRWAQNHNLVFQPQEHPLMQTFTSTEMEYLQTT